MEMLATFNYQKVYLGASENWRSTRQMAFYFTRESNAPREYSLKGLRTSTKAAWRRPRTCIKPSATHGDRSLHPFIQVFTSIFGWRNQSWLGFVWTWAAPEMHGYHHFSKWNQERVLQQIRHHISTGWRFGTFFVFHVIYGMSSLPLTFIFFRGVGIPQTSNY